MRLGKKKKKEFFDNGAQIDAKSLAQIPNYRNNKTKENCHSSET